MAIFGNLFGGSSANGNATATAALTALQAAAAANPSIAPYIALAQLVLGNAGVSTPNAVSANGLPVAPTAAQLQAAQQAVVTAQTQYQSLLAQVKAVQAYNAVMQQAQTASLTVQG